MLSVPSLHPRYSTRRQRYSTCPAALGSPRIVISLAPTPLATSVQPFPAPSSAPAPGPSPPTLPLQPVAGASEQEIRNRLLTVEITVGSMKKSVALAKLQKQGIREELDRVDRRHDRSETSIIRSQGVLSADVRSLGRKVDLLQASARVSESKINTISDAVEDIQCRLTPVETTAAEICRSNLRLEDDLSDIQYDLDELKQTVQETKVGLTDLKKDVGRLEGMLGKILTALNIPN